MGTGGVEITKGELLVRCCVSVLDSSAKEEGGKE